MTTGDAGKGIGVPELPYGWNEIIAQSNLSTEGARWMFGLVHAVYDANGLKQQLSDLQQRVEELEGELEAEKSNDHWLGEDA